MLMMGVSVKMDIEVVLPGRSGMSWGERDTMWGFSVRDWLIRPSQLWTPDMPVEETSGIEQERG